MKPINDKMKTISLCMIAKNEEKYLEQCLSSVKGIADEIIIVDTCSTDKTKEIAEKFDFKEKIKLFDYEWMDDFSAARNKSIKHATKDWILVLDADETIAKKDFGALRQLVKDKNDDAFLFLQKNYTNDSRIAGFVNEEHAKENKKYAGWYGSFIARLFRNKKGFEFEGNVHELVEPSIEKNKGRIAATSIVLHHYGNADPEIVKKKRQMYLELCKKKLKQKADAKSYYECGVLYKENNSYEDAIQSLKKAVELNPKHNMALYELGVVYEQQKDYGEAIKNYTESLKLKENAEAFQSLGVCCLKKGMLKESYRNLVKAMLMNPNKYTIYNNLGAVLEKNNNLDSAVQMLKIAAKLNPNNVIGFYNLGVVLDKKGDFENAIKNYERAVELGHKNKEEIKKRIKELKVIIENTPKFSYGFKVGG